MKHIRLSSLLREEKETNTVSPPYMHSPDGFGCHVCRFYYKEVGKHMCSSVDYIKHMGTNELIDQQGNQIEDPKKWCSNWFLPNEK